MQRSDDFLASGCRYFLLVAEAGSVRAAARQVNTAASAISRQVALLEASLGIALFERAGRTLRLSPAGEELRRALTSSALLHEQALDRLNALRGLKSGKVRIATVESVSAALLPRILEDFATRYPGLELAVTVAGSDAVTELVRDNTADVGFTFNPTSFDGLGIAHTQDLPLGAIVHPQHALARLARVSLKDCLAHPVAWPARGLSLRSLLDPVARRQKLAVKPAVECNSLRVMASLAVRGLCVAFQTPIGIEQELSDRRLRFIPLSDRSMPPDRMMLVHRPGLEGHAAATAFLEHARGRLEKLFAVPKNRTGRGK
ncbi:MAG: LysR family transcriptional regulator [Rhizobiales bacterium]|nr:LysR family transcriptional regulator [Hyphomicrobiales bacterium]